MIIFSGELIVPQAMKTPRKNAPKQQSSGRFALLMRKEMSLSLWPKNSRIRFLSASSATETVYFDTPDETDGVISKSSFITSQ